MAKHIFFGFLLCFLIVSCDSSTEEPGGIVGDPVPGAEVFSCGSDYAGSAEELLRWPAPEYTETVRVPFKDEQQRLYLESNKSYKIILPDTALTHRLDVWGGADICIVGGAFKLKGYADIDTNRTALGFWYNQDGATEERIIHVEGIYFDMADARDRDAIALNDENAIFQIQNIRFENVNGDHLGLHPDAIENWGGAKEIRIYKSTVITDHQGFLLSPLQPTQTIPTEYVDLQKIDFRRNDGEYGSYPNHKCPIYLWLVHYETGSCMTYPRGAYLDEVYATHADNCWSFGMNDTVPNTIQPAGCLSEVNAAGNEIFWPTLPFTGSVKLGPPAIGEFVPPGAAGIGYQSPGYLAEGQ